MNFFTILLSLFFVTVFHSCCTEAAVVFRNSTDSGWPVGPLGVITPNPTNCNYSETGFLNKMEVTSCTAQPCSFRPSVTLTLAPTFTLASDTASLSYSVYFYPACTGTRTTMINRSHSDTLEEIPSTGWKNILAFQVPLLGKPGALWLCYRSNHLTLTTLSDALMSLLGPENH